MHSINDAFDHSNHSCGRNNSSNKSQFIGKLHCLVIGNVMRVQYRPQSNKGHNQNSRSS